MNYRRGLLRLYLVLSLAWLAWGLYRPIHGRQARIEKSFQFLNEHVSACRADWQKQMKEDYEFSGDNRHPIRASAKSTARPDGQELRRFSRPIIGERQSDTGRNDSRNVPIHRIRESRWLLRWTSSGSYHRFADWRVDREGVFDARLFRLRPACFSRFRRGLGAFLWCHLRGPSNAALEPTKATEGYGVRVLVRVWRDVARGVLSHLIALDPMKAST